ncbi:MAG TPA: hypothetical protein VFP84_41025, partial [Kofleriaceae bacterium]|nr:hypothetical protein [Kofleriaceae bacterium]
MRALLAAAIACSFAGCDSRATASDPAARAEMKSKEYETCGASAQCADELRCFDQVCRRTARSTVGDYFAALGAGARGKGELEAAVAAYAQALLDVPLPWTRVRQVYALLGLAQRYGDERLD